MEKFKTILTVLLISLYSCTQMVTDLPSGKYTYFWNKDEPVLGIAIIQGKLYPYTKKLIYTNIGPNYYFSTKYVFLGHGTDYRINVTPVTVLKFDK